MELNRPRQTMRLHKPEAVPEVQGIYAPTPVAKGDNYRRYRSVPWRRRSGSNVFLVMLGMLIPPLLWWAVGNCLTGRIYTHVKNRHGYLESWCAASKFAAVIVLVFQTAVLALAIPAFATGQLGPMGPTAPSQVNSPNMAETSDDSGEATAATDSPKPAEPTE